jgi:U2 small nuclear ribonucleoprotein B''
MLTDSSVYVQNLEERVKLETLTEALRTIFSEFGSVIDIVAKKNLRAKGQAFVVFENPESARDAIEEIDGFELFGKPMKLAIARTRSDKTVELKGNQEELENHKRHREEEKSMRFVWYRSPLLTLSQISVKP